MNNLSHTIAILAYNNHELTLKNIRHLINLGYQKNILLFDNGSSPSYKKFAQELQIRYQREPKNIFVNPAWNIIFNQEDSHYLTLLNNDCFILSRDYFQDVLKHMENNNIGITSCKTKNIKTIQTPLKTKKFFFLNKENNVIDFVPFARRQGWLMTIDLQQYKKMDYIIPNYLKLWYGDDWIWGQYIKNNKKYGVYRNRYAVHIKNTTISSENLYSIINDDTRNLDKYGDWHKKLVSKLHVKSRLFNRYI